MKKKSDEELGVLVTREMLAMMLNEKMSAENRISLIRAIVVGEVLEDPVLQCFAESIKQGYDYANEKRRESIYNQRESKKAYARNRRERISIGGDRSEFPLKGKEMGKEISPPFPRGGKGEPDMVSAEDLMKGIWGDEIAVQATTMAREVVDWYPYVVNESNLKNVLMGIMKKNSPRALLEGWRRWKESEAWANERFVPRKIVSWFEGGQWESVPPGGRGVKERSSGVPSADDTSAILEDEG